MPSVTPAGGPVTAGRRALVVGGGIGGLAAALGLQRGGWQVQVLERAPAGAPPGSGLGLWPNGLRALAVLGVQEPVLAGAALGGRSGVRAPSGRWIARTDIGGAVRDRFGLPLVIASRQAVIAALAAALGADRVRYRCQVTAVDPATSTVHWAGQAQQAGLVVIADGARSRLRGAVSGPGPRLRYAGYTSWRFIAPWPAGRAQPAETWGRPGSASRSCRSTRSTSTATPPRPARPAVTGRTNGRSCAPVSPAGTRRSATCSRRSPRTR